MRWGSLLVIVLAACAQPRLQEAAGKLAVAPASFEVRAYAGFPVERSVAISNQGRAPFTVQVSASSGLVMLGAGSIEVASGQTVMLTVRIPATASGAVAEVIALTVEGARTEVPVTGEILAVPPCPAAKACQVVAFDPSSGECVEQPLADGTQCAAACLEAASCHGGACVGTARSCDDGNLCTQDSCAADGSCTHVDVSARCALPCEEGRECGPDGESAIACQAQACDPKLGCVTVAVADGTTCGPNDCSTAYACMSGSCQVVVPPEGSTCSEATPCQSEGKCVADTCVAIPRSISQSWQLLDTATVKRSLLGVVSPSGLIFAIERHLPQTKPDNLGPGIFVVAYTPGGFERWRSALYADYQSTTALYDVERAQLIVVSKSWARALDGATGTQRWFVDLANEIPAGNLGPSGLKQISPLKLTLLPEAKRVVASFTEGYESHAIWMFGLDLVTGQQAFKVRRDGHLYGMMATSTDEVFLGSAGCWAPASWNAAYDAAGAARWNVFQPGVPSLALGTQLYFQPYSGSPPNVVGRFDLTTGAMSQLGTTDNTAVLANGSKLFLTSSLTHSTLTAWDTSAQQQRWRLTGLPFAQAFLTEGDGVLALSTSAATHVSDAGKIEWSCALGAPLSTAGTASLLNGLMIGQTAQGIGGFPLGALKVSARGWSVSDRGNPERTTRSR